MPDPKLELSRCPSCGAANPIDASWCGQCLTRFDGGEERPARADAPEVSSRPILTRTSDGVRWTCPACEASNQIEATACTRCGSAFQSFFSSGSSSGRRTSGPRASRRAAVSASVALPGAGHWLMGARGEGVARAVLYVWTLGLSILLLARPPSAGRGIVRGVAVIFLLAAVGTWLLSLLETLRLSENDRRALIPPRTLSYVASALSGALFFGLVAAALAGR